MQMPAPIVLAGAQTPPRYHYRSAIRAQCTMAARALVASCALLAFAGFAFAQDAVIIVANATHAQRVTSEDKYASTIAELHSAKNDALLLYTDFASRAGNDLKTFLTNITGLADRTLRRLQWGQSENDANECWTKLDFRLKKIEHDARKAAVYSGDCHHKFLLGHMIVFRIHLNKSEDYLKRCDKVSRGCGRPRCEVTPRVIRWQRLALAEIHQVRNDMKFTRRSYRDLVSHARRKLNHLKKQALSKSCDAVEDYKLCINRGLKK